MSLVAGLSPRQKAAVVVRVLLQDERDLSLEALPADQQAALVRALAEMDMIDQATRDAVVSEFCDTLEQVGVTFPVGLNDALALLGGRISPDCADRLRRIAALSGDSDPWERLLSLPAATLTDLARTEAVEMTAVLFSRLPPARAAEVFGKLPAQNARRIARTMSLTAGIEKDPLRRIGLALMQAVDAMPQPVLTGMPEERVGEILNHTNAAMRDDVLDGLDQDDQDFAAGVRRNIFTWANIPARIEPRDIPRILKQVDQASLVKALAAARGPDAKTVEFIYAALSTRMVDALKDEIEMLGTVPQSVGEVARASVVAAIRQMQAEGDLTLIMNEVGGTSDDAASDPVSDLASDPVNEPGLAQDD